MHEISKSKEELNHSHGRLMIEKKLGTVFAISMAIFVIELTGGILGNSLALISDSFHIMTDFLAIGLTFIAFRVAQRSHSPTLSFGFHRIEIFAALANGITLVGITGWILYEAYLRFFHPGKMDIPTVLSFAAVGLVSNIVMAQLLKKESKTNLNIKGCYVHVLGDLLSTGAVIGGAVLMIFIPNPLVDILISIGISILILRSGISMCKECFHIFMEGTPHEIKLEEVSRELQKFDEITEVHDLHIWTLTSNIIAMSVHIKVKQQYMNDANSILKKINNMMKENFGINHCTIQIENEYDLFHPDK